MKTVSASRYWAVFVFLLLSYGSSAAQNARSDLERTVHFNNVDLVMLVAQLAADQELTVGFEVDPSKPRSQIALDLRNVTAREVVEAAVRSEPIYQMYSGANFISIYPVKGRSVFLDTPVNSFDLKDVDGAEAIEQLMNRPEVEAIRRSMNLQHKPVGASAGREGSRFSLHVEATSLRQALNQIARAAGSNFWLFRASRDGSFFLGVRPD